MEWLHSLYPRVRQILEEAAPAHWSELGRLLEPWYREQLMPPAILPLAACQAVNGRPGDAIYVSAALIAAQASLRIIDDIGDQDRPGQLWQRIGHGRAWNYASALQSVSFDILSKAPYPPALFRQLNQLFVDAYLAISAGQDRDMAGLPESAEDYWLTIEWKTATAYSTPSAAGALVGTADAQLIEACRRFGHHVGLAVQYFNDMESIWQPDGIGDLQQGKITLPLVYGLQLDHPKRRELLALVEGGQIASQATRIQEILEKLDIRAFLVWAALQEREAALSALAVCPNEEGRAALYAFVTGMFGDIDALL